MIRRFIEKGLWMVLFALVALMAVFAVFLRAAFPEKSEIELCASFWWYWLLFAAACVAAIWVAYDSDEDG
jgi:hypothetical protein